MPIEQLKMFCRALAMHSTLQDLDANDTDEAVFAEAERRTKVIERFALGDLQKPADPFA